VKVVQIIVLEFVPTFPRLFAAKMWILFSEEQFQNPIISFNVWKVWAIENQTRNPIVRSNLLGYKNLSKKDYHTQCKD